MKERWNTVSSTPLNHIIIDRTMRNIAQFIIGAILGALGLFFSTAGIAGELISNPTFLPSAAKPATFYMRSATGWIGTGQKNVGVVSGASNGLWLGVTTSVFTGSLSRTGWDIAPNTSQAIVIPVGCTQQTVTIDYGFVGVAPWPGQTNDLVINIGAGKAKHSLPWSTGVHQAKFTESLPAGTYLVDLSFSAAAKQMSGGNAGITVGNISVVCP